MLLTVGELLAQESTDCGGSRVDGSLGGDGLLIAASRPSVKAQGVLWSTQWVVVYCLVLFKTKRNSRMESEGLELEERTSNRRTG